MKLTFYIDYRTNWGESVYLVSCNSIEGEMSNSIKMDFDGISTWSYTLTLPDSMKEFTYCYVVRSEFSQYVRREFGKPHRLFLTSNLNCEIHDIWQDVPADKSFYSSAFTQGIFSRETSKNPITGGEGEVLFNIKAPIIKRDEVLAVSGSIKALGEWNPQMALILNDYSFPKWFFRINVSDIDAPFEYKFLILKKDSHEVVAWENCNNRYFDPAAYKIGKGLTFITLHEFNNPLPNWKGAGTAIPVFSLRSNEDFGVGDFYDLFKMVDWAKSTGQKFIQILPINDTTMTRTWVDSYPYSSNSIFALHPMYVRPEAIGELNDKERLARYRAKAAELNALAEVDYEQANEWKLKYVRDLYEQLGAETFETDSFKEFVANNEYWLKPYSAFCVLRDTKGSADFTTWGYYSSYDENAINKFCEENIHDVLFFYFLQYHLDKQLREVRDYAHSNGVVLKGDIPIGISRESVDAWSNPRLFNLDCQAGAPPDDFSVLGQNWGLPTYNWEEMNKDGFSWWKNRFRKMSEYFDAYRIDHILGFFRIWQIPMNAVHGLLGTFYPALPFSEDEMRNLYDFWLDKDLQTNPYIMDYFLNDFFGEYTEEAKNRFLYVRNPGRYGLKEEYDTQAKVVKYFSTQEQNEKNEKLKNALLGLIDEVLFIEDAEQKGKYHPRISAQFTYIYRSLNDYERWCFNRLYNDFFYHRHNDFWYGKAMWKLPPLIDATDMLVCGEDLGMIPDCVPAVMHQLQILSLEIQRMPKDPKTEFGNPLTYPYTAVCTTSTHDMPGIRAWWEEDHEKTQRFFNNMLHEWGNAPYYAEPWVCERIVTMHLNSPAMLTILPLQDWLAIDGKIRRENPQEEQINNPSNAHHYWRYRMHITLDDLLSNQEFNTKIQGMITHSGR